MNPGPVKPIADVIEQEDRELARARQIGILLDDEIVAATLAAIRADWSAAWQKSRPSEGAMREELYHRLLALDELEARLAQIRETGKLAETARALRETPIRGE